MSKRINSVIYWNALIRFLFEGYVILAMCSLINMLHLSKDTWGELLNSVIAIIFLVIVIGVPILVGVQMYRYWSLLLTEDFYTMYGELYENLLIDTDKHVILQPVIFFARRLMLSFTVVYLQDTLIWQIVSITVQVIVVIIYIGNVSPFKIKIANKIEIFNEVCIMLTMYNFLCFSDFVPDIHVKIGIGFFCISFVALQILVNLFLLAYETIRNSYLRWKLHKFNRELVRLRANEMLKS